MHINLSSIYFFIFKEAKLMRTLPEEFLRNMTLNMPKDKRTCHRLTLGRHLKSGIYCSLPGPGLFAQPALLIFPSPKSVQDSSQTEERK